MFGRGLSHISTGAWVPEQLVHYVGAVSGRTAILSGGYVAYVRDGHATLVAYPWTLDALDAPAGDAANAVDAPPILSGRAGFSHDEREESISGPQLAEALESLAATGCAEVTILAPFKVQGAGRGPGDWYWQIALPRLPEGPKLRNMLRRAAREVAVGEENFGPEHQALVGSYLAEKNLSSGTRSIFAALPSYARLAGVDGLSLGIFTARRSDGSLAGFAIGDFTGLHTAFYMFAFRARNAPQGTADLLLRHILDRAEEMGHRRLNLGLGINPGIVFFKQKWGASPLLPHVESTWLRRASSGIFTGLRRLFRGA